MVTNKVSSRWNTGSKNLYGKILIMLMLLISRSVLMSIGKGSDCFKALNKRGLHEINVFKVSTPYGDILTTDTDDDALDYIEAMYLNGLSLDGVKFQANNTGYIIEDITVVSDPPADTNDISGIRKRWTCSNAPLGTHFTQRKTVDKGLHLTNLTQASGCFYNGVDGPLSWNLDITQSIDKGFDTSRARHNAKLSYGYTLTKKATNLGNYVCNIPVGGKGALFSQSTMYWEDQQKQKCVRRYYGTHGCKCGDWSAIMHGVIPASNVLPKILCVTGSDSGCN